jgi:F-type H+-transporting ATPase subunit epsilon
MAKPFSLEIIAPDKAIYQDKAVSLVVPAELGYLGVLADHAPLAANLREGKIIVQQPSGQRVIFHSQCGGFLRVLKNDVVLILDAQPAE